MQVDDPTGERWDLALDLLATGEEAVTLGDGLGLHRETGFPGADGRIHIALYASALDPPAHDRAQSELDVARAQLAQLAEDDGRFGSLIHQYGSVWEYQGRYGKGAVLLASVSDGGELIWPTGD